MNKPYHRLPGINAPGCVRVLQRVESSAGVTINTHTHTYPDVHTRLQQRPKHQPPSSHFVTNPPPGAHLLNLPGGALLHPHSSPSWVGADPRCPGEKPAKGVCPEEGPEPPWVRGHCPRRDAWPREAACRCLWWALGTGRTSCGPRRSVRMLAPPVRGGSPSSPLTRTRCGHLAGAAVADPGPTLPILGLGPGLCSPSLLSDS